MEKTHGETNMLSKSGRGTIWNQKSKDYVGTYYENKIKPKFGSGWAEARRRLVISTL